MDDTKIEIQMNGKQKILVILLDIAMLIELCVAMHAATQSPDTFTPTFVKVFFSMLLPTLAVAFVANRILRDPRTPARS